MSRGKFDIYVFADWEELGQPILIGLLSAHFAKAKKAFSFSYDKEWLKNKSHHFLDPDIGFYSGAQFPSRKTNFGIFLDSMPDTWGRTLMRRREAQNARIKKEKLKTLYDIDYLLGVYDSSRMGAIRFKTAIEGNFLDEDIDHPTPPWSSLRELQEAARQLEGDKVNIDLRKWLAVLIAPGSSLGGARPKANIFDNDKNLWIAKFPAKSDVIDKAAWEYLAYKLAIDCGIEMAESKIEKVSGAHHTFLTKRFDRNKEKRIENYGVDIKSNLHQLWRRIIFNISISNTDDHLRNHGFILKEKGWGLSPAYDINPSIDKDGLSLNIDMDDNALSIDLVKSVGKFFRLSEPGMDKIIDEVLSTVSNWKIVAQKIGISRKEQELMAGAFKTEFL